MTVLVVVWPSVRYAQGLAARNDRYPVDRISSWHQQPAERAATLVVGDPLALRRAQHYAARGSRNQFLQGVQKILLLHAVFTATSSQQSCLVDEVFEVGTHESRRRGREKLQIDIGCKRHPMGVDLQDGGAARP